MSTPKNWPPEIKYLYAQEYSKNIPTTVLTGLKKPPPSTTRDGIISLLPSNTPRGTSTLVKITLITNPSHPANGQSGLFAVKDLKPDTFILRYQGEVHLTSDSETDPHANSNYDLSLDRYLGIGIDAEKMGNEARFINDFRGIGERANAEFREVWDERLRERGIGVFVVPERRDAKGKGGIKKGEEILVSYGKGFWGARKGEGGG